MSNRLTKIYTRKGDDGYTSFGSTRIAKDDLLIEAIGTIDELNSAIGCILSQEIHDNEVKKYLTQIQHDLFDIGGELYLPEHPSMTAERVTHLEQTLDQLNQTLPPLKEFILPRGNQAASACHLARAICRRAERSLVRLHRQVTLANPELLKYLNRLSDLLFVIARVLARESDKQELMWEHERKKF